MRNAVIFGLVLTTQLCLSQVMGRLPGVVFPADRGARTAETLQNSITGVGGLPSTFVLDRGVWEVLDDFSIPAHVTIVMLPGAKFHVAHGKNLEILGGFSAGVEEKFTGTGTVSGPAFFPYRAPEWGDTTQYDVGVGYLEETEAADIAVDTSAWEFLSPSTETVQAVLDFVDAQGPFIPVSDGPFIQGTSIEGATYDSTSLAWVGLMPGTNVVGATYDSDSNSWSLDTEAAVVIFDACVFPGYTIDEPTESPTYFPIGEAPFPYTNVVQVGTSLNPTNGVFTAPVAGWYQFNLTGDASTETSAHIYFGVVRNGNLDWGEWIDNFWFFNVTRETATVLMALSAGDTTQAVLARDAAGGWTNVAFVRFSGQLIYLFPGGG